MNLFNYKLILQYKGTHFFGWQIQPDQRTIQGELNKVLQKIAKSESIKSWGCGRTDAGVHALEQVVKVVLPLEIEPNALRNALNSLLDEDIKVIDAQKCLDDFNPISQALWKEYVYVFSLDQQDPFLREWVGFFLSGLDTELMKQASSLFVGEHDFQNYFCVGTNIKSTIRTIFQCEIETKVLSIPWLRSEKELYALRIQGSGFLKQMVRLIMGTLVQVGNSKVNLEQVKESLHRPLEKKLGPVAPAQGLYLSKVSYSQ